PSVAHCAKPALRTARRPAKPRRRAPFDAAPVPGMRVAVADYGAGNLRSLCAALTRAGAEPFVTTDAGKVRESPLAVVAGVGHVASAAAGLAEAGVDRAMRDRAAAGRPLLGICVGMQLLFEASDEGGEGLGLLAGPVKRLE